MIPFKDDFVKKVDVTNKRIDIEVVEGMLWK
jgi:ribosomal 30S subunit maturation factor RimM